MLGAKQPMAKRRRKQENDALDAERVAADRGYRRQLARRLLDETGDDADHVQLRRAAREMFPELTKRGADRQIGRIVGYASTLRKRQERKQLRRPEPLDWLVARKPVDPIVYPDQYADLDDETRARLIHFCRAQLDGGSEGREALQQLDLQHGWPYSDRTFYVGPWKAARLRSRKESEPASTPISA